MGYAARPIAWFAALALPIIVIAVALIVGAAVTPGFAMPMWGSALILLLSVGFLVPLGILSELLQRMSPHELASTALTTSSHWKLSRARSAPEIGSVH